MAQDATHCYAGSVICLCVCVSVFTSLNPAKTDEPIEMGEQTPVGPRKQGNHLVNTMDRSVRGGDAVKCRVTVAACLRLSTNRSTWRHLTN